MYIKITAWVKDSPNIAPIAEASFRSDALAYATARLWEREGFRVEQVFTDEAAS